MVPLHSSLDERVRLFLRAKTKTRRNLVQLISSSVALHVPVQAVARHTHTDTHTLITHSHILPGGKKKKTVNGKNVAHEAMGAAPTSTTNLLPDFCTHLKNHGTPLYLYQDHLQLFL